MIEEGGNKKEKIESISIIRADTLPLAERLKLGISSEFVQVIRFRSSPLQTKIEPITGLPSDLLMEKIDKSVFKGKPIFE